MYITEINSNFVELNNFNHKLTKLPYCGQANPVGKSIQSTGNNTQHTGIGIKWSRWRGLWTSTNNSSDGNNRTDITLMMCTPKANLTFQL